MEAVCPTKDATRDSLELWVFLNIQLNARKANPAMAAPAIEEMGALIHMLRVAST
jgi:hypothetical protein